MDETEVAGGAAGRPGGAAPPSDPAAAVRAALDRLDVDHEVMPCDPAFADTAAFCEHYGIAPEDSANTIVVAAKRDPGGHCACVVLATTRLDVNGAVRRETGFRRASFASAEETMALTGMAIGGVTPFALPDGLPVLVDAAVMGRRRVVLGGGDRSSKVVLAPDQLLRVPGVRVVEGLALAVSPG